MKENQEFNKLSDDFFKTTKRQYQIMTVMNIIFTIIAIICFPITIICLIIMVVYMRINTSYSSVSDTIIFLKKTKNKYIPLNVKIYKLLKPMDMQLMDLQSSEKATLLLALYLVQYNNWTIEKLSKFFTKYKIYNKISQTNDNKYHLYITIDKEVYTVSFDEFDAVISEYEILKFVESLYERNKIVLLNNSLKLNRINNFKIDYLSKINEELKINKKINKKIDTLNKKGKIEL